MAFPESEGFTGVILPFTEVSQHTPGVPEPFHSSGGCPQEAEGASKVGMLPGLFWKVFGHPGPSWATAHPPLSSTSRAVPVQ